MFSRRLSNWSYASSRINVSTFAWISDGPKAGFQSARSPDHGRRAARCVPALGHRRLLRELRVLGAVRLRLHAVRSRPAGRGDARHASTRNRPPSRSGPRVASADTELVSGSATDNMGIRAVRWTTPSGRSGAAKMTWTVTGGDYAVGLPVAHGLAGRRGRRARRADHHHHRGRPRPDHEHDRGGDLGTSGCTATRSSARTACGTGRRAPLHSPNATKTEVVGKIIYLRQHYHFGPQKISMYLKRYHDVEISPSGVWRILKRLDMNRLPASQRYKRHDRPLEALREAAARPSGAGRREVHRTARRAPARSTTSTPRSTTAPASGSCGSTDATTRRPRSSSSTTSSRSSRSRSRCVQTDNGAEFQGAFHWHVLDRGIGHVYIKPATPRLNGKVERSHRIDAEEFYRMLDGVVIDDTDLFNDKLQEWEDFYNFHRPHGGLDGQTPSPARHRVNRRRCSEPQVRARFGSPPMRRIHRPRSSLTLLVHDATDVRGGELRQAPSASRPAPSRPGARRGARSRRAAGRKNATSSP